MNKEDDQTGMHKRRITLHDGRYLIFYTFEDERKGSSASSDKETEEAHGRDPRAAVPQAEEERSV
jgi:predicted lipoprotein with Yx(FWY)xxD motif